MASIRTRRRADGSRAYQVRAPGVAPRTFSLKQDAVRFANDSDRRRLLGELYVARAERFGDFLEVHIERKRRMGRKAGTIRADQESAARLGVRHSPRERHTLIAALPIPQVRRAEVEDILAEIAAQAPRRAQMCCTLVKQALRSAQARGQIVDGQIFSLEQARFLTVSQLDQLGTWLPEYIRRIVPIAGLLGMRQGELFDLVDRDLKLDAAALQVRSGKTKAAARKVELSSETVALLREQLLARPPGTALVFSTSTGLRWNRHNFMGGVFRPGLLGAAIEELGQGVAGETVYGTVADDDELEDRFHFHDLKHTAVSLMALAGWRFEHVARQVGWAPGSWARMWARYRHLFDEEMQAQAAKLDALVVASRSG